MSWQRHSHSRTAPGPGPPAHGPQSRFIALPRRRAAAPGHAGEVWRPLHRREAHPRHRLHDRVVTRTWPAGGALPGAQQRCGRAGSAPAWAGAAWLRLRGCAVARAQRGGGGAHAPARPPGRLLLGAWRCSNDPRVVPGLSLTVGFGAPHSPCLIHRAAASGAGWHRPCVCAFCELELNLFAHPHAPSLI